MLDLIEDNRQRRQFQKLLSQNLQDKVAFKNIVYCGKKVATGEGLLLVRQRGVDGEIKNAQFLGLSHCGNGFFCPVCSSKVSRRQGKYVAGALEMQRANNCKAFMVTFTVGHAINIPLSALLRCLHDSWQQTIARWRAKRKPIFNDYSFKEFAEVLQIRHYIRSLEITWGPKYGWHPHFHVLFFVDADKFDKVLSFEERLQNLWLKLTEYYLTSEQYRLSETQKETVRAVYSGRTNSSIGIYISKDNRGQLIEQQSSSYLAGWSADNEVTGLAKVGRKDNFSILQLIKAANSLVEKNFFNADSSFEKKENPPQERNFHPAHNSFTSLSEGGARQCEPCCNGDLHSINFKSVISSEDVPNAENLFSDNEGYKMNLNELKPAEGSTQKEVRLNPAKAFRLVKEALAAVFKKYARFSWSHTGLKKQAITWLDSLTEDEYKKKFIGEVKYQTEVLAFFPLPVANLLLNHSTFGDENWPFIEAEILKFAFDENGFSSIAELTKKLTGYEPLRTYPGRFKNITAAA